MQRIPITQGPVAVTASEATTEIIPFGQFSGGIFFVRSGSAAVTITWYVAFEEDGTYYPANAYDGTTTAVAAVQTVEAGKAYELPSCLAGAKFLKAVGNDTATLDFCMKG